MSTLRARVHSPCAIYSRTVYHCPYRKLRVKSSRIRYSMVRTQLYSCIARRESYVSQTEAVEAHEPGRLRGLSVQDEPHSVGAGPGAAATATRPQSPGRYLNS